MGNRYAIDPKAKASIDDAATKIKKASEGYGFRTRLSDHASHVYFILNDDYHLQLHGPLNIESTGWDNSRTFGSRILGDFKPFFLCGYYTDQGGYTYGLSMPAKTHKMGKVGFRGTGEGYYPQVLLDNMYVKPGYYSYIQPNEDVVLYMIGEVDFFKKADLQRDRVNPILHLVFNLRINSTKLYNTDQYKGPGLDVMFRQNHDEAIQAGVFGSNSSMAGTILNEADWRPLVFLQQRGVDQMNRRIGNVVEYIKELKHIRSTVECKWAEHQKTKLSHLDIDFKRQVAERGNKKLMGIIDYDDKKKRWSIAFPEVLLVPKDDKNPLPRESFGAFAVRGYLTLQQNDKTLLLKNKEAMNGAVYIRNETEKAVDRDSYWERMRWYQREKKIWDKREILKEVAKEERYLSIQIEDMDFTENGKSLNVLDRGTGVYADKAELGLILYGNGIIGGRHVTVLTLRLWLEDIKRDHSENGKYTFEYERYDEKTEPITAYFHDF